MPRKDDDFEMPWDEDLRAALREEENYKFPRKTKDQNGEDVSLRNEEDTARQQAFKEKLRLKRSRIKGDHAVERGNPDLDDLSF